VLASNVEKLVKTLDNHGVEFVIIGGAAAVLHGSAYVTGDLDVCYSREKRNLKKLAVAPSPIQPIVSRRAEGSSFSVGRKHSPIRFELHCHHGPW
jgi:hypothetical protein